MNKHFGIRICLQTALLFLITPILFIAVHAQGSTPEESRKKYENWLEKDISYIYVEPLDLKLTTLTPALCIDSTLVLELEIKNISAEDVVIDLSKLWSQFSYGFTAEDHSGRGGGMGINHGHKGIQTIVLQPGATYWSRHEFTLAFDFFQDAGKYDLKTRIDINGDFSNAVEFELYDCGKPQKIED